MTARRIGPALVLASQLVGVGLGERAGPGAARGVLAFGVVSGVGAVAAAIARRGLVGLVLCCLAASLLGAATMRRALDGLVHSPIADAVRQRDDATVDVTLTSDPDASAYSAEALATVDRARTRSEGGATRAGGGRTIVVDASGDAAPRLAVLSAGDRVRLRGYFRPLDDFEASARWRHAVGTFAADDVLAFRPPSGLLLRAANAARRAVLAGHRRLPEPDRALVAGFLLGDTARLPDDVVDDFRQAGMSHLLAVSGQNVAFVLALAAPLVRRGPRLLRLACGLAILVGFATMTRFEPSVLRASAMAACAMAALAAGRPTSSLRALTLAVIGLVLADPFLVHSVGFALSCAASAGIAILAPRIANFVPGPRPLAEAVAVATAAQIAVAPVLVAVFGGVPLVAVPANVVAAPFAGPLTILGLAGGVVGGVLGGPAAVVVSFPVLVCASTIRSVAHLAARVPLMVRGGELLAALVVGGLATVWMVHTRRATWRRALTRPPRSALALSHGRDRPRPRVPDVGDGHPQPHA